MRRKWSDDPLVPISGPRLFQAMRLAGVTLPELASRLKEKRQTLDYIVRGKTDRCRQGRRSAIARALGVPAEWLGGAGQGGMEWLLGRLSGSPLGNRAQNRLGRRCQVAVEADESSPKNAAVQLLKLTIPGHWRGLLFHDLTPELLDCRDLSKLEEDVVRVALADALEIILRPWLEGQAKLNRGSPFFQ